MNPSFVARAEIERLHALAAGKVKNARGTLGARLEATVAATHWILKDESETAARYREEASKRLRRQGLQRRQDGLEDRHRLAPAGA